jgi:hypothetical protein
VSLLLAILLAAAPGPSIDPTKVRDIAQEFAICAVKHRPELASKFVLDSAAEMERHEFRTLFDPDCVPTDGRGFVAIRGGRTQMAFALAEALVRRQYPAAAQVDINSAAPLDHTLPELPLASPSRTPWSPEALQDLEKSRAASLAIFILGECVVRAHPVAAHGLLLTEPGSDLETRYLEALQPAAGNCIEKGAAISMTKYSLRGTIALNFYRLAMAPRVPEAAK